MAWLQLSLGDVAGLLTERQVVLGDLCGALQFGDGLIHGYLLLGELLEVLVSGITAGKRQVHIDQRLGAFLTPEALLSFIKQQYLALRQLADSLCFTVAGSDERGVDVAPARRFAT